jgi:hypothetical protein
MVWFHRERYEVAREQGSEVVEGVRRPWRSARMGLSYPSLQPELEDEPAQICSLHLLHAC